MQNPTQASFLQPYPMHNANYQHMPPQGSYYASQDRTPAFNGTPINSQAQYAAVKKPMSSSHYVTSTPDYRTPKPMSSQPPFLAGTTSNGRFMGPPQTFGMGGYHQAGFHQTGYHQAGYSVANHIQRPAPSVQYQHIPYEYYYIDYEPREYWQQVTVPVQRTAKNYYAIEHVTDYVPREWEETVVDMVAEERIKERKVYLPVQTHLVHFPADQKRPPPRQEITHRVETVQDQHSHVLQQEIHQQNQIQTRSFVQQNHNQNQNQNQNQNPSVRIQDQNLIHHQQTQQQQLIQSGSTFVRHNSNNQSQQIAPNFQNQPFSDQNRIIQRVSPTPAFSVITNSIPSQPNSLTLEGKKVNSINQSEKFPPPAEERRSSEIYRNTTQNFGKQSLNENSQPSATFYRESSNISSQIPSLINKVSKKNDKQDSYTPSEPPIILSSLRREEETEEDQDIFKSNGGGFFLNKAEEKRNSNYEGSQYKIKEMEFEDDLRYN